MTTSRKEIVDPDVTRWYHCISRVVRGARLLQDDLELESGQINRKQWIEERLQFLTQNFAVAVGGFAVLDNHLHVLTRLDPQVAAQWSAEEVVRRWLNIYPPLSLDLDDEQAIAAHVKRLAQDTARVTELRDRLKNLSWFMKALKEPLSRLANRQDGAAGTFWQGRFKSIAILDLEALLSVNIYVDLNVFAAGLAGLPEKSPHTSVKQRVANAKQQGKLDELKASKRGSVIASTAIGNLEEDFWLVPIEDRRPHTNARPSSNREGMLETMSLGNYLLLLDYTSRLFRNGKANLTAGVADILDRLGSTAQAWGERMKSMLSSQHLYGTFFAADRTKLDEHSSSDGKRRANLTPQVATKLVSEPSG